MFSAIWFEVLLSSAQQHQDQQGKKRKATCELLTHKQMISLVCTTLLYTLVFHFWKCVFVLKLFQKVPVTWYVP